MTEREYREAVASGIPFVCGGVEYHLIDLIEDKPDEDE